MTLEKAKAEINKVLDEFDLCLTRAWECQRDAARMMNASTEIFARDPTGPAAAVEIVGRLQRIASKVQRLNGGGDPHGPA